MHSDFKLFLRRNTVEAASAGIALDSHDCKTVACILSDALKCFQSALVDRRLQSKCLCVQAFLVDFRFRDNLLQFLFLVGKYVVLILKFLLSGSDFPLAGVDYACKLIEVLFSKLYFEGL